MNPLWTLSAGAGNVDKPPPMCYFCTKGAVIINRSEVRQVLNLPCSPFVDFAIDYANLTPDEKESIEARERLGLTITEAAIHQNMCETRHKNLYRKGMEKLTSGWDGQPWIYGTLNAYKNIKH